MCQHAVVTMLSQKYDPLEVQVERFLISRLKISVMECYANCR